MERVVDEVKKMKIGDPLDRSVAHGPQNHKYGLVGYGNYFIIPCREHFDSLLKYVEVGEKEGATLVYGGRRVDRPGESTICLIF